MCDPSGSEQRDEHLRNSLTDSLTDQLAKFKYGRFPIPESFTLMAAADRTHCHSHTPAHVVAHARAGSDLTV